MSKTLEAVGMILGGVALALLSGPIGIGVIGSLSAMNAMIGIGLTTALGGVGLALRQTPAAPVGTANSLTFNNAPSPRRVIYGQFQTAGVLTYASFPPAANQNLDAQYLHVVYTLTGHEIESFDAVIINGSLYQAAPDSAARFAPLISS